MPLLTTAPRHLFKSTKRLFGYPYLLRCLFALSALLMLLLPTASQAQQPVVYGVFFYSPTCPHCQDVLTNHWPAINDEFGDQLKVLFVNVTIPEGSQLMGTAVNAMHIQSNAVPMLIIGTNVLIGSSDIPAHAPDIIRAGLEAGGIGYPPIPNIDALFQSILPPPDETASHSLTDDPANIAALIVLLGLLLTVGVMGVAVWQVLAQHNRRLLGSINGLFGRQMAFVGALVGIGLSGSLLIGSFENPLTLVISTVVLAAFTVLAFYLFRASNLGELANRLLPVIVGAGILVAGYLTYVELTLVEATCGIVGNCNVVQQSSYARILGIPVGVIGILGYTLILALWVLKKYQNQTWIDAALFLLALLGVSFSIYLTVLEPFVIGASCVWCLTSAVVMGILLWMTAPAGWHMLFAQREPQARPLVR